MIPLFRPNVGEEELNEIRKTFETGWIGLGPKTEEFEKKFAEYFRVKHAIALNSCTAALDMAFKAFDIKSGEVILPAMTFVSTAHAAVYNNVKPVFADVDEETLCIDINDLQEKITDKTKAIIPVHMGGHPCDMNAIMEIAENKNIVVIEDVAEACGAEYKKRKVGTIGDVGCFSFEAKKNLTTGDGGMIVTNNSAIVEKLRKIRWCGIDKNTWQRSSGKYSWYYEVPVLGYKFHMNDIQAAIGSVQLKKLDWANQRRREIVERYFEGLSELKWLKLPVEKSWAKSAWWLFIIKTEKRDKFVSYMKEKNIETGVHFMPIYLHPFYKKYKTKLPVTDDVWKKIVDLPLFPNLKDVQINEVIDAIKNFSG